MVLAARDRSPKQVDENIYTQNPSIFEETRISSLTKENTKTSCLFSDCISKLTNTITLVSLSIKETRRSLSYFDLLTRLLCIEGTVQLKDNLPLGRVCSNIECCHNLIASFLDSNLIR